MNLRPYAREQWFQEMTEEQKYRFEERLGILCADRPAHESAIQLAKDEALGAQREMKL